MKVLVLGDQKRYEANYPGGEFADSCEKIYAGMHEPVQDLLAKAGDADFIAADAIAPVTAGLIDGMPNLKLIHSEGVAFHLIDLEAAAKRGIPVCNNAGVNALAVAEHTLMLMLMTLRQAIVCHEMVMSGKQIDKKLAMMGNFPELSSCRIGLIGFGNIGKQVARLLKSFGCEEVYCALSRKDPELEEEYQVSWADLEEIRDTCDIISIHVPVTPLTTGMIDLDFFKGMKKNAILINTARGEIVDNEALITALKEGMIAGAALDTVAPEPVEADHPLLHLPEEVQQKIIFSPHIAGVTSNVFKNSHIRMWKAFEDAANGRTPRCVVNGVV